MKTRWLVLCEADNVATALDDLAEGETLDDPDNAIVLRDPIAFGHKFARTDIPAGSEVIKYGETIGTASEDISAGEHVHVHNLAGLRGRGDLA